MSTNNIVSWSVKNDRRMQHSAAVGLLQQNPDWTCHPILTLVPGIQQIQGILQRIPPPEPIPVIERHHSHRRYFTDGACESPTQPLIRGRAWAVIQDLSEDNLMRDKLAAFVSPTSMTSSHLTCIQTEFTHGAQTAARAELIALTQACQRAVDTPSCQSAECIVDAQYVVNEEFGANRLGIK